MDGPCSTLDKDENVYRILVGKPAREERDLLGT